MSLGAALLFGGAISIAGLDVKPKPLCYRSAERYARGVSHIRGRRRAFESAERQRVIEGVIRNLKEHYVDRDVAQKIADALLVKERSGDDNAAMDGGAFAALLTRQVRDVSNDMHLEVVYSQDRLPDHPGTPSPESLANYRRALERESCTFESVKILPHNIGYLKLNSFPDVSICRSTVVAAMASLEPFRRDHF